MATKKCPNGHQYDTSIYGDNCPFCIEISHKTSLHILDSYHMSEQSVQHLKDSEWDSVSKIEYRFLESSIPPQYHRSYTISISASSTTISIDCYGKELLKKKYRNTFFKFLCLKEKLSALDIYKHKEVDSKGCTGGQTEYFRLYKEDYCIFDGYVYHCKGDCGTLHLPQDVCALICDAIPTGVQSLIESTLK